MKTIGFIGGGRVTRILLKALSKKNVKFQRIVVCDPDPSVIERLKIYYPEIIAESALTELTCVNDMLIIAVHPPVVLETLNIIKPCLNRNTLLISLAPRITISSMRAALGGFNTIARVNPSASAYINDGINPVAFAEGMPENTKKEVLDLLGNLGEVPVVAENKIEAYAMISAMGSTYFWFQLQHLSELAVKFGMDDIEAKNTISGMLRGTADTLFKSGLTSDEVMDLVPVRPLAEYETAIKSYYTEKLEAVYRKIKPD